MSTATAMSLSFILIPILIVLDALNKAVLLSKIAVCHLSMYINFYHMYNP